MSEKKDILALLDMMRPPMPKEYADKGWTYLDPPSRFSPDMWQYFLSILGEGEYKIIAQSEGRDKFGHWQRGQLFVSPQARENMKAHLLAKKEQSHD